MNTPGVLTVEAPSMENGAGSLRPRKRIVTRAEAAAWSPEEFLIQRKFDGEFCELKIGGGIVLAEFMRRRSGGFYTEQDLRMFADWPGGFWAAFTVASIHGENLLDRTTRERWGILCSLAATFTPDIILASPVHPRDFNTLFADGAEGFGAHAWNSPWGEMLACKIAEIYEVVVTGFCGGTNSVEVRGQRSEVRGRVALRAGKCEQVRVGSVLRVEGMGLTAAGKIREPRLCREWLVKF